MIHSCPQIQAMYAQEDDAYCTRDYLSQDESDFVASQKSADTECRYKMAEWCYQVADFSHFNRETVAISMNYLDRFLMTCKGQEVLKDRKLFQLAAMTCLYTAVKIHEDKVMEPRVVANLSRGKFTAKEVKDMERSILTLTLWRMNPPTALSFIRQFVSLLPEDAFSESKIDEIMELSTLQTELAVRSYVFVGLKASQIGIAALKNSLLCSDTKSHNLLSSLLEDIPCIGFSSSETFDVQEKLFSAIATTKSEHSNIDFQKLRTVSKIRSGSGVYEDSPRSVLRATEY